MTQTRGNQAPRIAGRLVYGLMAINGSLHARLSPGRLNERGGTRGMQEARRPLIAP